MSRLALLTPGKSKTRKHTHVFSVKPTVTPADKEWVEEAFLWFEEEYTRAYLQSQPTLLPTREFFPIEFRGTRENAEELKDMVASYMGIRDARIALYYFTDKPLELADGIVTAQRESRAGLSTRGKLGTYTETGHRQYSIGIEQELLKSPMDLIATLAHELSHLVLLGEGRLSENDEVLTDLNSIALGFGIFTCNSIFRFTQWQGSLQQGWQANTRGYIPEEVATYALALLTSYQGRDPRSCATFLNASPKRMFERNMKYLKTTDDAIAFKA